MTLTAQEEQNWKKERNAGLFRKYGVVAFFLLPFLSAFIVFFIVPLFYGIHISLTNYKYSMPGVETYNNFYWFRVLFDPSLDIEIFQSFWLAFAHTITFVIVMVPIAVLVPLGLALLINKKPIGYKAFRAIIYMPSIVPLTASGVIFTLLFLSKSNHGLVNEFLGTDINWLSDTWFSIPLGKFQYDVAYAWIPIFLMCFWGGWGGNFIILSAGLNNVSKNLYEAADIDGCGAFKKFLHVTLPGIKPQMVLCLFTTIIGYMGLYGQNFVLSGGGPTISTISMAPAGGQTSTLMYFIQDIVANDPNNRATLYGLGAASSLVFALFVGIISGVQMYLTRTKKTGTKLAEQYAKWQKIR